MPHETYLDKMENERDEKYEKRNSMSSLVKPTEVNYKTFDFHEMQENLVDIMVKKTGKNERGYFRILVAYKFCEIASHMRTSVEYTGSDVPVNLYGVNLAGSGFSKDFSMNLLDKRVFGKFRSKFEQETFKSVAELNLQTMADVRVVADGISHMQRVMFKENSLHCQSSYTHLVHQQLRDTKL